MTLPPREFLEEEARSRLVRGDLFSFDHPVIPVKTRRRTYGSISRQALARGGEIPDVPLGGAVYVAPFVFVALWADDNKYTEALIAGCSAAALTLASRLELPAIAMPLLGGKEGSRWIWAMEKGIYEATDRLDDAERFVPEHVFVTDKNID